MKYEKLLVMVHSCQLLKMRKKKKFQNLHMNGVRWKRKKASLNSKAMNVWFYALDKKEFH